ncbi:MAG TPA: muconolactone Delta-isomerase family protein [Trebonia sp.]
MEFLVTMTTHVPEGTPAAGVDDVRAREAANTRELAVQGHVLRLWRPPLAPGEWRTLGLFAAADAAELERVLATMPLRARRAAELAKQDHLVRLWALPPEGGVSSALGLWRADGDAEMQAILQALPLYPYLTTTITWLTPHPSDPAAPGSRSLRIGQDHG